MHDNLDGTHGALHHGCHLCVWGGGQGISKLFSELGISTTQAINMFLKQAVREQRIPFEVSARPALERGSENMEK